MTRIRKDDIYILDTLTKDVNFKIQAVNKSISYEKNELLKTEALLQQFQNCLAEQNRELNRFVKEGREIEREIATFSKRQNSVGSSCVLETCTKESDKRVVIMREDSIHCDNGIEGKVSQMHQNDTNQRTQSKLNKEDMKLKPQYIQDLKTFTVYAIKCFNSTTFYGGSNGLLMSYEGGITCRYATNTTDSIVQIEFLKLCGKVAVVAFTNDKIIVFRDMVDLITCKEIDLPGMVHAYNEGNLIYISLMDGTIKKLNKEFWKLSDYLETHFVLKRVVFTVTLSNKFTLVRLQDNQVYKTQYKSLVNLQQVRGLKDVKVVLKAKSKGFLCYSEHKMWMLDKMCDIVDTKEIPTGISFVDTDGDRIILIDVNNLLKVYPISREAAFEEKIFEQTVEGEVTAVHITAAMCYVAIGDEVYVIDLLV